MFSPIAYMLTRIHGVLQRTAPSNRMLTWLRSRSGLRWGIPAMLIGVAYIYVAAVITAGIDRGWPEPLYLLVILFIFNGLKFLVFGPVSVALLLRARRSATTRGHATHV